MLEAAGHLTLELARECLKADLGLKDATPLNVLFRGTEPVFIDVLSFERRDPGDPTWLPYAQFVRTFLLPMMANQRFGLPVGQVLLNHRDGLEPEQVYRWLGPLDRIRPSFITNVSMPVWLGSRHKQDDTTIYRKQTLGNPEKARFIVDSLLGRLHRALKAAAPKPAQRSVWSNYMSGNNNYSQQQFEAKQVFVEQALKELAPGWVLDVGCNTGVFSELAARSGASVVAIDYDPVVAGQVWRRARAEKLDILPLVVDLTRPTPAVGWMNQEWSSFLDRARGHFDAVLMLAVIHHMLVTERVPLVEIMSMAAQLTTNLVIVEFIEPGDSMFRQLLRGREHLHRDLTVEQFEQACRREFEVVRSMRLPGAHRSIYLLRKRVA
jgi:SAM-dependent methyltransferase